MVQNYYKFEPSGSIHRTPHLDGTVGMIASPFVNQIYYDNNSNSNNNNNNNSNSHIVTVSGLEHVIQWNMRTNQLHNIIHVNIDNESQYQWTDDTKYGHITCMAMNDNRNMIAVGYQSGRIIVYRLSSPSSSPSSSTTSTNNNKKKKQPYQKNRPASSSSSTHTTTTTPHAIVLFNSVAHNSSVTSLSFDHSDSLLASGGDDSDIIVWDIVACRSLYKLRGHKSRITSLLFYSQHTTSPILVSSSKDMLIKVWELDTQHCVQTLIGSRSEIYALMKTSDESVLVAGSTGNELRIWDMRPLLRRRKSDNHEKEQEQEEEEQEEKPLYLCDPVYMGTFFKQSQERVIHLGMDCTGQLMSVISDDRMIELFRLRPETELNNRFRLKVRDRVRRLKKRLEKKSEGEEEEVAEEEAEEEEQDNDDDEQLNGDDGTNDDDSNNNNKVELSAEEMNRIKAQLMFAPFYSFNIDAHVKSIAFHPSFPFKQNEQGQWVSRSNGSGSADDDLEVRCIVSTLRNCIMEYAIVGQRGDGGGSGSNSGEKSTATKIDHKCINRLDKHGHDTPIRSLSLSRNANLMLSTSGKHARVWSCMDRQSSSSLLMNNNNNTSATQCIRVLDSQYGLSSVFVPGDKHVIIGTKKGQLELFDISSGQLIQHVTDAHKGAIWSMVLKPDMRGIITASSDMTVKFWDFELDGQSKQLCLSLEHTLKMNEDVISIAVSPRGKYLAISLLDNTVKVFYLDTLKFFISLYGHKLPVNSIAISSDEQLIATASADKNVKIWGLDFGDCHKSIFAHEASITQIAFVRDTHYFFTCGKDGAVKYWDADTYQLIQVLRPVRLDSPLWSMALCSVRPTPQSHHNNNNNSRGGAFDQYMQQKHGGSSRFVDNDDEYGEEEILDQVRLVVAGHDRVILSYEQNNSSDALLFIEEEEEKRQEEEYEKELVNSQQFVNLADSTNESTHAGKRTIETIRDGEKLMDCLKVAMEHEQVLAEKHALLGGGSANASSSYLDDNTPMEVNPLLLGLSVNQYVWRCLTKIAHSELDMVMAILPYNYALYVLEKLNTLFVHHSETCHVEYATRVALILIHIHQTTILMDHKIFPMIHSLSQSMRQVLVREREVMGLNMAALSFVKNHIRNELEFREVNDQIVSHVHSVQQTKRVLSYREKQREQAKYKKDLEEREANKYKKDKPKKGRFQGMLDALMPREDEPGSSNQKQQSETLTFEVKESAWKEAQKKRKRESEEEKRKKLKSALQSNNDSESESDSEMQEVLSGL